VATLKGAFINIGAGVLGFVPNVVVFQFNPDRVTRTPTQAQPPPAPNGSGARNSAQQPGMPPETISFTLRVDVTDQLANGNPIALTSGILPTLSALELLMVPKRSLMLDLFALGGGGHPHRHPPESLPTVLFFWGPFRILPVAITSLSITETEYDVKLTPIRAEISVNLHVLTPDRLANQDFAKGAYAYSQGIKEVMAALNLANAVEFGTSAALSFGV
jgi:hypothetical protein